MSEFAHMEHSGAKSDSDKYVEIIINNIGVNRDDFSEKIQKRIKNLKEFYFRSGVLTVHFDEIVEDIRALGFNRIKFWEHQDLALAFLSDKRCKSYHTA